MNTLYASGSCWRDGKLQTCLALGAVLCERVCVRIDFTSEFKV